MGTLGTYLRNAREARGLDLREAAQQTRISHAYLVAIEKEDFAKLPGEVFVKGFLKNYAKFLRISEDEVMRLYAESKSPPAPATLAAGAANAGQEPLSATVREQNVRHEGTPRRDGAGGPEQYVWAAVVLAAIIAVLLVIFPKRQTATPEEPVHSDATGTVHVITAVTPTTRPGKLYLDISALDDLWVLIRTDSSPQKKAVLRRGESVTWSAYERFLLSISSVPAARILLNGRELTIIAPPQSIVRDMLITASGLVLPKMGMEQPRPRTPKAAPPQRPAAVNVPAPAATAGLSATPSPPQSTEQTATTPLRE